MLVGFTGSLLVTFLTPMFDRMGVDDPVGASAVHGLGGIWGVIAVGLFADNPIPLETTNGRSGLFKGGGWYLLGVQCLAALCLLCWVRNLTLCRLEFVIKIDYFFQGILSTAIMLWIINLFIPIRMDPNEELIGADLCEHKIKHNSVCRTRHTCLFSFELHIEN